MLIALILVSCAIAGNVPTADVDDFLDAVLRQGAAGPRWRPKGLQLSGPLGATLAFSSTEILGPTELRRYGSADGSRSTHRARASAVLSLGQLGYGIDASAVLFGFKFSARAYLTLKDAYSPVYVSVTDDEEYCHVHVRVEPPSGEYLVRFESLMDLPRWFTEVVEYVLQLVLQYVPLPYINERRLFSDATSHLERELTKATREISCGKKQLQ